MRDWLVAADDRTGAFEVAAELAAVVGTVTVTAGRAPAGHGVVDLGSRGLSASEAAALAADVDAEPSRWTAHKIDSTLRGNWAVELRARQAVLQRPVLLIAAWPLMGRICLGGVVYAHGTPVADVHDHLPDAVFLAGAHAVTEWRPSPDEIAVVDVVDTGELLSVAAAATPCDVLVAGPAGAVGAVFAGRYRRGRTMSAPSSGPPVLVVCGSATEVSREQLARLAAARPDVEVLATPPPVGPLHHVHVAALAEQAHERLAAGDIATLVIIGGDTAAAVLGNRPRLVGGYAAPGMPWSHNSEGGGPLVITKAGGFGGPDALVYILRGQTG